MRPFFAFYRITRLAILRLDAYALAPHPPSSFPDGLTGESAFAIFELGTAIGPPQGGLFRVYKDRINER
jgi:hypothetical protein